MNSLEQDVLISFSKILTDNFSVEKNLLFKNIEVPLMKDVFKFDAIDFVYLLVLCEKKFNIQFNSFDIENYNLLTPQNWVDTISHKCLERGYVFE